ncbi:MAG: glycogen debranching enzyme N-terminal domain-containing protein [Bacteroidales bacterium]
MSYLKFDKSLMINLEQSLPREILRTNKSGAYHCTTIVGCNTRKQHGLLVIPIPEMDEENHVMLSSLDETVIQHGAPFNLGIHKYQGNVYSPNGHKYIREFDCDEVPKTVFRVGGVVLSKEKIFISHENRLLIRYTLIDAHSETTLQFRPFLAFRNANDVCVENGDINKDYRGVDNGVSFCLYEGYPSLYMQFNRKVEFVSDSHWYNGIEYTKDQERGYPYREDLYVPGYFQMPIKKGESIILSTGTGEIKTRTLTSLYEKELLSRTYRISFYNCLKNSAQQFYLKRDSNYYLLAGYPWFKVRARDLFISTPGCTLYIDDEFVFHKLMGTALGALSAFIEDGTQDKFIKGIEQPDIPLWAIWALQQYAAATSLDECIKKYGAEIEKIMHYIISGGHPNLFVHENGLLYSDGRDHSISWMTTLAEGGRPVTARTGYLVEFNALWYNALKFYLSTIRKANKTGLKDKINTIIDKVDISFRRTFLNQYGYLYDYVDGSYGELSVRPNMVFAVSLEYSPLDRKEKKGVLDVITRELLTPKGLRTLSPKSYGYRPVYFGHRSAREQAYYQGPVRPWLMGAYAEAYLKIFGLSGVSFIERMLIGFEEEMSNNCIGTISELFDGNPPYTARGGISFAVNVAEILRVLELLKKYNNHI